MLFHLITMILAVLFLLEAFQSNALSTDKYLTHYWPICNGELTDQIASANMFHGENTLFAKDRFGMANSALSLNGDWTQVPSGIYFDTTELSISVWILPLNISRCSRLIDFSNSNTKNFTNNIYIRLDNTCYQSIYLYTPELAFYSDLLLQVNCISTKEITIGEWQLLTATFNGNQMSFYINGSQTCTTTKAYTLPFVNRAFNYIGKSFDSYDGYSSSFIDDLRFYNKCLTQTEILELMNDNSNNFNFFNDPECSL
jgi:hypothetical protein